MRKETKAWLAKIAKINGVTEGDVLRYLRSLSFGNKVIHHLRLK